MMKRIAMGLAFVFAATSFAQAQKQEEVNKYLEYNYDKRSVKERKAVPYPPLREADVIYAKRVERIIDVREKKNLVMQWPKAPLGKILYEMATAQEPKISAYRNDSLTSAYSAEDARRLGAVEEVVPVQIDPDDPFLTRDDTVFTPYDYNSIKKFKIYEEWIFDKQRGMFFPRIIAIAPIYEPIINGVPLPEMPMFYLSWAELRPILINEEVFNRSQDAMRLTYYDFFEQRLFSSYITKESNPFDYAISDFPEYKDSPMEALYESERVKEELFNFEHDLWEY